MRKKKKKNDFIESMAASGLLYDLINEYGCEPSELSDIIDYGYNRWSM